LGAPAVRSLGGVPAASVRAPHRELSKAYAINATGQIVGQGYLSGDAKAHAFVYRNGTMIDLDTLGNVHSDARHQRFRRRRGHFEVPGSGVADAERIRLRRRTDERPGSAHSRRQRLAAAGSGSAADRQRITASAINDGGQIVGAGMFQGQQHAFLLNSFPWLSRALPPPVGPSPKRGTNPAGPSGPDAVMRYVLGFGL
jgi:probable HAF family extracellular repeat protein